MNVLDVYWLKLETLSPMIIASEIGKAGYVHLTLTDFIPGSMLKGAILSSAILCGSISIDEADKLAVSPDMAVGSALRTYDPDAPPLSRLLLTHTLCFRSKWGGEVLSLGADELAKEPDYEKTLANLIERLTITRMKRDGWKVAPGEVKPIAGRPAVKEGARWRLVGFKEPVKKSYYVQVALDHVRGGSSPGALYAYEHVPPGATYSSLIAVLDISPLKEFFDKGEAELRIGRGISRGFGLVKAVFSAIGLPKGKRLEEGERIALEALSPIFVEDPLPRPPRPRDLLTPDLDWYQKMLNLKPEGALRVRGVLGSTTTYRGWSVRTNLPKLPIKALKPGSILICEVEGEIGEEVSAALPILGINHHSSAGFNQLIPLKPDPFRGG